MLRFFLLVTALAAQVFAGDTAASLAAKIREASLDPEECYRVREMNFNKEDLKFYFTEGFLIFAKPVNGHRLAALFSAEVEGGDAEIILMTPLRSERQSLGNFTGSPNLDEHFRNALFVFSGATGEKLLERAREAGKKSAERGMLLAGQYGSVAKNIAESFEMRLVEVELNPTAEDNFLFSAVGGTKLGNFDVIYDPRSREQIMIGQLGSRGNAPKYDIWASFESRSVRKGGTERQAAPLTIANYRIEAALDDNLHLSAVTRFNITPSRRTRAFAFALSDRMEISEARLAGAPAEVYTSESLRATAIRGAGSRLFLLVTPEPLEAGKAYEVEFHHNGDVVFKAGNGVYSIGARGNWYPNRAAEFTTYDMTFRYPKRLNLVATGEVVDERTEGETRITHRRTSAPVRFAGFNLGDYERVQMNRAGQTIEVYGNRRLEPQLQPKPEPVLGGPRTMPRRMQDMITMGEMTTPIPPSSRLTALAEEVAGAVEFMTKQFGPPPLKTLTVSPIPGAFGQGFPGLVYLSTLSYISPEQRPAGARDKGRQVFFSDLLAPHEVAHQWWGNLVTAEAYQDAWLMEALANYSALVYLEKRKGVRAMDAVLDEFRADLLMKREDGETVESLGPITWGTRLETSESPAARTIVYEKGAWILHMLRLRMGDERFFKMLNEVCKRYRYKTISTGAFRALAEEFLPPGQTSLEAFFESWVYGTGVPVLKVTSSTKGKAPALKVTATVTQTGVDEDFSVEAPVEFVFAGAPTIVKWVRTANEPVTVTVPAKRPASKVMLETNAVLAVR